MTTSFSELRPTRVIPSRTRWRVPASRPDLWTTHALRLAFSTQGKYSKTGRRSGWSVRLTERHAIRRQVNHAVSDPGVLSAARQFREADDWSGRTLPTTPFRGV